MTIQNNLLSSNPEATQQFVLLQNKDALKKALRKWAEQKGLKTPDFADKMGYSYNHAYQILRGELPVTAETMGRMALGFGSQAVAEIEAIIPEFAQPLRIVSTQTLPHPVDADPVPLVIVAPADIVSTEESKP